MQLSRVISRSGPLGRLGVTHCTAGKKSKKRKKKGKKDRVEISSPGSLNTPKTAIKPLVQDFGYVEFPQLSPDGKLLAFNVVRDHETSQLLVMDLESQEVRSPLTDEPVTRDSLKGFLDSRRGHLDEQGTWKEDGSGLYYRTNHGKGNFGIGSVDLGGREEVVLYDEGLNMKHPCDMGQGWLTFYGGPVGKKYLTDDQFSDIYLANLGDQSFKPLTHSNGKLAYKHPAHLQEGIVAHVEATDEGRKDVADLVSIDPTTGEVRQLTETPAADERHAFYSEAKDLMIYHREIDGDKNLVLSTPDGSRSVQLTFGERIQSPCWAPDGESVVFIEKGPKWSKDSQHFERDASIHRLELRSCLRELASQAEEGLAKAGPQARARYQDYLFFLQRF